MTRFAAHHFNRWLDRYHAHATAGSVNRVEGWEAWHRLETYWITCRGRSGKCYKDWLFARGSESSDALRMVTGGARLLLRDVAREYISTELAPASLLPLDAPIRPGSDLTWNDLLPNEDMADPARSAEARELATCAARCAEDEFIAIAHPVRLAWLARELGLSLADSGVVRAARASKSTLFRELERSVRSIATRAAKQTDGVSAAAMEVSIRAVRLLRTRIRAWGAREKSCAVLCRRAGVVPHSDGELREVNG